MIKVNDGKAVIVTAEDLADGIYAESLWQKRHMTLRMFPALTEAEMEGVCRVVYISPASALVTLWTDPTYVAAPGSGINSNR